MRNLTLIFVFLFTGWSISASVNTKTSTAAVSSDFFNDSFIFVEGGVEFAIYPNGEFDFYYNPSFRNGSGIHVANPNVNISYNSGYNYDPYIQFDDFGAVIQIENVPIYYDYYGRIIQAGDIFMDYNNFGRLARVGNLRLHYNNHHRYTHHTGFINSYNTYYVYRPWHEYYRRPRANVSIVFGRPYRAYYEPRRVSYNQYVTVYNNYYANNKRQHNFYRPSERINSYNYGRRTVNQRNIAHTKSRTRLSDDIVRSRQRAAGSQSYSSRSRTSSFDSAQNGRTNSSSNNRRTMERSNRTTQDYSSRTERSTDSRGISTRIEPSVNEISRQSAIERRLRDHNKDHNTTNTSTRRVERSNVPARTRSLQNNSRSVERKSTVQRPTRQRSATVKERSNTRTVRSQSVRKNNSSGSRSSARNMDNRL